jgi:phosphoribosylanthranilate isomerase
MTLVKICGITNLSDARACIEAGADALGFNFYRKSPRFIEPALVREIVEQLPDNILTVGVFVNEESPAAVERIANEAGVEGLQLHGEESPEYCESLNNRFVIKAMRVDEKFDPQSPTKYKVSAIMLDGFHPELKGGTGRVTDWVVSREVRELVPKLFLAGGLSPENVASAITAVEPYAVDACSALEISPGKKDPDRVRAFVNAVKGY